MSLLFKKVVVSCVCLIVFLASCAGPFSQKYFVQQQTRPSKDAGNSGGITGGWEDDPDLGTDDPAEEDGGSGSGSTWTMFAVLQADGLVLENLFGTGSDFNAASFNALKAKLADGTGESAKYSTGKFAAWEIRAVFSGSNVPTFSFASGNSWQNANTALGESRYNGPNSSAGNNSITNMVYFRYKGLNPLFPPDSTYNKATYKTESGTAERVMERFEFYRFTGKGGGVAALDNMLVAVDTYTKLVFAFAKPTKTEPLLGQQVPKEWGPVDLVSTGPGGKKYKFYEYDPAGYVKEDGSVVLYNWYTGGMGRGSYDPVFTGKSPYLGRAGSLSSGSDDSGGTLVGGYAVTGDLVIKAKYLRNDSVTDVWGDHGNADGTDMPEFIFDIRARAYDFTIGSGFELPAWESLSSYKPSQTGMMPKDAMFIKKGSQKDFTGGMRMAFKDAKGELTAELDSRIIEVDISGNDWITEYETPIIFLTYDRFTQKWKLASENRIFLNGPVTYSDANFSVGYGDGKKDLVIKLPAGSGEYMSLCYSFSWERSGASDDGGVKKIVSVDVVNKTQLSSGLTADDCAVAFTNGAAGEFTLEITDFNAESASKAVQVNLELLLGNLLNMPNFAEVIPSASGGTLRSIKVNGSSVSAVCAALNNSVDVSFTIDPQPTQTQSSVLTLELLYSGSGYDTVNSPKKVTVNVIRNKYVAPKRGKFAVSNVSLKNVSVMDVGGDAGDGDGYSDPEFIWELRTRKNAEEWIPFAVQANAKRVSVGKTQLISGNTDFYFDETAAGKQRVYIDSVITEIDRLAGNENDPFSKFGQPQIYYEYNQILDEWYYRGDTYNYYFTSKDLRWELKKVSAPVLKKNGGKQRLVITLSSYIADTIWPSGNIADFIAGPRPAGWGDIELSFDVEWINN